MTRTALTSLLAAAQHTGPPMRLFYAIVPILILAVGFDVYCLVDLFRSSSVRHLPKAVWAVVIIVISAPWGGLIYLFLGRNRDAAPQ
ncbi:MAG TPA: PLDc N-terminal domain-containing protein [Streptosporangiaceae bacterium]|jgi:hypothetical protein